MPPSAALSIRLTTSFRSLRFVKKFFWFSDEAVDPHTLSDYLKGEKLEVGKHNVAHAGQTGKGLLFFAKRSEDKSHPAGILNLVRLVLMSKRNENDVAVTNKIFHMIGRCI